MNPPSDGFTWLAAVWAALALPILVAGLRGVDFTGRLGGAAPGPHIDARWGWLAMELPPLVVLPAVYAAGARHAAGDLLVAVWMAHYAHRALVWPWIVQRGARPMPVALCAAGITFNLLNGAFVGWGLGFGTAYPADWFGDPRFVAGAALLVFGAGLNVTSDYQLAGQRRRNPGRRVLPRGGAFRWVSCPNLSGEMIEWTGFALMCWSLPALAFALWTVANLLPRALWRHGWYRRTFDDYPPERRAVIPGLL